MVQNQLPNIFQISANPSTAYISWIPYTMQENSTWCGEAVIQMVLGYYGKQKSQETVIRFRLKLLMISLFIRVLLLPFLAMPK